MLWCTTEILIRIAIKDAILEYFVQIHLMLTKTASTISTILSFNCFNWSLFYLWPEYKIKFNILYIIFFLCKYTVVHYVLRALTWIYIIKANEGGSYFTLNYYFLFKKTLRPCIQINWVWGWDFHQRLLKKEINRTNLKYCYS